MKAEHTTSNNEVIMNGCKAIDKGNGLSSFVPVDGCGQNGEVIDEPSSFFRKIISWLKNSKVKPYVKTRDLTDPFGERRNSVDDIDARSDGRLGIEVGVKVEF